MFWLLPSFPHLTFSYHQAKTKNVVWSNDQNMKGLNPCQHDWYGPRVTCSIEACQYLSKREKNVKQLHFLEELNSLTHLLPYLGY
jgi:hypothetical protein